MSVTATSEKKTHRYARTTLALFFSFTWVCFVYWRAIRNRWSRGRVTGTRARRRFYGVGPRTGGAQPGEGFAAFSSIRSSPYVCHPQQRAACAS